MVGTMSVRAVLAAAVLTVLAGIASAQEHTGARPPDSPSAAETLSRLLETERAGRGSGLGIVLVDAVVEGRPCRKVDIVIAGKVDGQVKTTTVSGSTRFLGALAYDGPKTSPAGELTIASLICHDGSGRQNFVGPHAKFRVRPGEFADLGTRGSFIAATDFSPRQRRPTVRSNR